MTTSIVTLFGIIATLAYILTINTPYFIVGLICPCVLVASFFRWMIDPQQFKWMVMLAAGI